MYNIKCSLRNCVRVAQQTLTLFVWVRILVPQPKKDIAYAVSFFIQSEGLVCNRRQAYVISSPCELYVIKPQGLYVSFLRIDYIPPTVGYIQHCVLITYRNKLRIAYKACIPVSFVLYSLTR